MKKPFKTRIGWAIDKTILGGGWVAAKKILSAATHRVRVSDARELTAERAVERALQAFYDGSQDWGSYNVVFFLPRLRYIARSLNMTATVKNGKVRVRKVKRISPRPKPFVAEGLERRKDGGPVE